MVAPIDMLLARLDSMKGTGRRKCMARTLTREDKTPILPTCGLEDVRFTWMKGNCNLLAADMSKITIQLNLDEQQANKYPQRLTNQYEVTMADLGDSDRYRKVPAGQRSSKALPDLPCLAEICCTRCELKKQLDTGAVERAQ